MTGPAAFAASDSASTADWQTSTPDSQGMSTSALESALAAGATVAPLRSVVVARNGMLVGERYYGGASASDLLPINSATKSVCSILVGKALSQGKLSSLSQTVGDLLPELSQKFPNSSVKAVTLAQILTGTTGIAYEMGTHLRQLITAPEPGAFVLGMPIAAGAGTTGWTYNDAAVSLLTPILERAYAMPLLDIATREIAGPLGIANPEWERDKAGRAMAYMGLKLRPRDLLKLAWLMADEGKWGGKQVVPAEWVRESTRAHVAASWHNPPITDIGYGYLWFTGVLNGTPLVWAWGYGGQFALFVPSKRLAVATAATSPRPQDLRTQTAAVAAVVASVVAAVG